MKQTRQAVGALKQSMSLDVYVVNLFIAMSMNLISLKYFSLLFISYCRFVNMCCIPVQTYYSPPKINYFTGKIIFGAGSFYQKVIVSTS